MRISRKIKMYICVLFAAFHIICGISFEIAEANLLFSYTQNSGKERIQTYICNNPQKKLLIGSKTLNASKAGTSIQNRIKTTKGCYIHCILAMAFFAWFLRIAYVCRRLIGLPDVLLISVMRNIIYYMHKQDGKKDVSIAFC